MPEDKKWFEDAEEVRHLLRLLHASGEFDVAGDPVSEVLYYLEKPYKWQREYEAAVFAGWPETLDLDAVRENKGIPIPISFDHPVAGRVLYSENDVWKIRHADGHIEVKGFVDDL